MKIKEFLVLGCQYGCEINPALTMLRIAFPNFVFNTSTDLRWHLISYNICLFSCDQPTDETLSRMRDIAVTFRNLWTEAYNRGHSDAKTYGEV